jgi:hypothetical protein
VLCFLPKSPFQPPSRVSGFALTFPSLFHHGDVLQEDGTHRHFGCLACQTVARRQCIGRGRDVRRESRLPCLAASQSSGQNVKGQPASQEPHNTTATPAPATPHQGPVTASIIATSHPHAWPAILTRRIHLPASLTSSRSTCSVDVDTTTHDQPRIYPPKHLEPGSQHHLPSRPSLWKLQ